MYRNNKKNFLKTLIIGVLLISVGIGFFSFGARKSRYGFAMKSIPISLSMGLSRGCVGR